MSRFLAALESLNDDKSFPASPGFRQDLIHEYKAGNTPTVADRLAHMLHTAMAVGKTVECANLLTALMQDAAEAQQPASQGIPLEVESYRLEVYEPNTSKRWILLRRWNKTDKWVITQPETMYLDPEPGVKGFYHFWYRPDNIYTWDSAEEAYAFWTANRSKIIATAAEQRAYQDSL